MLLYFYKKKGVIKMVAEIKIDEGPKLAPGAILTEKRVADIVEEFSGIPEAHLEISTKGLPGKAGTDEIKIDIVSDLPGHKGDTMAKINQPI